MGRIVVRAEGPGGAEAAKYGRRPDGVWGRMGPPGPSASMACGDVVASGASFRWAHGTERGRAPRITVGLAFGFRSCGD